MWKYFIRNASGIFINILTNLLKRSMLNFRADRELSIFFRYFGVVWWDIKKFLVTWFKIYKSLVLSLNFIETTSNKLTFAVLVFFVFYIIIFFLWWGCFFLFFKNQIKSQSNNIIGRFRDTNLRDANDTRAVAKVLSILLTVVVHYQNQKSKTNKTKNKKKQSKNLGWDNGRCKLTDKNALQLFAKKIGLQSEGHHGLTSPTSYFFVQ